jgi:hypothetical protein
MTRLDVLRPGQRAQWMDVLAQSFQYDFYHLPGYHALAEEQGEGRAHLFVYTVDSYLVALPLLLRPLESVPGLEQIGAGWWDATSVYGCAGPVVSEADVPASVVHNFQVVFHEALQERHIVAVFSRLHPFIPQRALLSGLGEYVPMGQTVSIDLTLPVEVQRAQYRRKYRQEINKLKRLGATCVHDQNRVYLDEFIELYYESMHRVQAAEVYFFDRTYFEGLVAELEANIHLFVCLLENKVMCAGLVTLCDGIVQNHLLGVRSEFHKLSPTKLLYDMTRLWANECGAQVFHLGGGTGAREDSLFQFKAGFSKRRHEFAVWRWVLLPGIYEPLCQEKAQWNKRNGLIPVSSGYFPAYRCPTQVF